MSSTVPLLPSILRRIIRAAIFSVFAATPGLATAAFFQLAENSPAALGNANAGGAAIAEDASTVWFNPAGLTRLTGQQVVVGGHFIIPSLKANNVSGTTATGTAIGGGNGGDAGESALVPNFYYSHRHSDRLTFALGLNAPFGLATDYDDGWTGRYHADRSEIKTINVNPAVGYKINESFSIGAGISWQKLEAELSQSVDFGTICFGAAALGLGPGPCTGLGVLPTQSDGKATINADDDAWGYNIGLLWQLSPATRLGVHYRSEIDFDLRGALDLTAPSNVPAGLRTAAGQGSGVAAGVTLPSTLSLSVFNQISPMWAVMGDVTRTSWSDLPALKIDFTNTATPNDSVVTLNLKDVNRYAAGGLYNPGGAWVYRFGVALDKSPTPNATDRTPRLPDADRKWFSFGAGYKSSDRLSFDIGYTYIIVDDARVEKTATGENTTRGSLTADYDANTHILSAQANWKF